MRWLALGTSLLCALPARAQVRDAGVDASPPAAEVRAVDRERLVAEGRGVRVTAGELADAIAQLPPALRVPYLDPARLDQLVRGVVRDRLLAAEARQRGLDQEPRVQREVERVLSLALAQRVLETEPPPPVTPADVQRFYDAHLELFTRPERVRAQVIVVATLREAVALHAQLHTSGERRFGAVATRLSLDRRGRLRRGDVGWITRESPQDPAVVTAILALSRDGAVSEAIAGTDGRFYLARRSAYEPATPIPLDQVRATIESRIRDELRRARLDTLADELARRAGLRIDPAAGAVVVTPSGDAGAE